VRGFGLCILLINELGNAFELILVCLIFQNSLDVMA